MEGPIIPKGQAPPEDERPEGHTLHVSSIYGARTRQPLIQLTYDDPEREFNIVMSVATARNHAQDVLECVEAAVGDAFLFEFIQEDLEQPPEVAAEIMVRFRRWRANNRL